jgi:hypothetical protein
VVVVDEFLLVSCSEPSYFSMLTYMPNITYSASERVRQASGSKFHLVYLQSPITKQTAKI